MKILRNGGGTFAHEYISPFAKRVRLANGCRHYLCYYFGCFLLRGSCGYYGRCFFRRAEQVKIND